MLWLGPTWIEVNLKNLAHNLSEIKKKSTTKICAVIKGDAYGHGAVVTGLFLTSQNIDMLAVSDLPEALELRSSGVEGPILVLTPPLPPQVPIIITNKLIATVSNLAQVQALAEASAIARIRTKVHLKLDTGMGRIGASLDESMGLCQAILDSPHLVLEGIYTHFASAFNDLKFTRQQLQRLLVFKEQLAARNIFPLWHSANSAAFLNLKESHLDMVRIGTLLYGQSPVPSQERLALEPTWKLYSRIIQIKSVPKGTSIGYDRTYFTRRKSVIGVIPLGYGDGLGVTPSQETHWQHVRNTILNLLDNPRKVIIDQKSYPIIGKVAMGMCCIDLTDHPNPELLYGCSVEVPTRRTTINRRLPKLYRYESRLEVVWWNQKIYLPFSRDNHIYLHPITHYQKDHIIRKWTQVNTVR